MATLAHTTLAAEGARPTRWVTFLHGLLGRGANWRSVARRWVDAHPEDGAILVDLRLHGDSRVGFLPPHTVAAAADDVLALGDVLGPAPAALVGHSLGGKVALAALARDPARFDRVVVLDASPSARPDGTGSEQSRAVLDTLARLPAVHASRAAFVDAVVADGHARPLAQWLAMNGAVGSDGRFHVTLDLPGLEALLASVLAEDDWPVVTSRAAQLGFVLGGRSPTVDAVARERLAALPAVRVEVVPDAGHWVHVDAPDATSSALERLLAR